MIFSPFPQFAKLALFHVAQGQDLIMLWQSILPSKNTWEDHARRPFPLLIQNYLRCLDFQEELRKWDGPEFPSVFKPIQANTQCHNISLAEDKAHPLRRRRLIACWSPPTPGSRRLRWTHTPLWRLFSLWKSLSPGRDGKKQYSCFSSSTRSLHIVVEDARINLSVSRWWHELELGSIHKNWAVLRIICVI